MLILLPPSEGKNAPVRGRPLVVEKTSLPALHDGRREVLDALVRLCAGDPDLAARTLGLGSTQQDAVDRNAALPTAPASRADRVYSGVLYEALGLPSLPGPQRRRASRRLVVTSALFGLLRPQDRIPAYRLSGDVDLPGVGKLPAYWRPRLDRVVPSLARGLLVDLRSSTYSGFWRPDSDTAQRVVTVRVLHEVHGRRSVVSHFNKATKGRLVRDLLGEADAPATAKELARGLERLGWDVEPGAPGRHGTPLDVVVSEL